MLGKIKGYVKGFGLALVHPREALGRAEFWLYLLMLALVTSLVAVLTAGSTFTLITPVIFAFFAAILLCGRFKSVGLKWFLPLIMVSVILVAFIVELIVVTVVAGDNSELYSLALSTAANSAMDQNINLQVGFVLMGVGLIFFFIWALTMVKVAVTKEDKYKGKKLCPIVLVVSCVLMSGFISGGTIAAVVSATETTREALTAAYNDLYKRDENGVYQVEGLFSPDSSDRTVEYLDGYYEEAGDAFLDKYAETSELMVELVDGVKISSIMAQNANNGATGFIVLGLYKDFDDPVSIVVKSVALNGDASVSVNKECSMEKKLRLLGFQSPVVKDGDVVTVVVSVNGVDCTIQSTVYNVNSSSSSSSN